MANYDSADLLARFNLHAGRPSSDASLTDAQKYEYLSDAQHEVARMIAVHCPHAMMTAPTQMSTSDSGLTYTFSGSVVPLAVEIYESATGRLLRPCAHFDAAGDYVWEGSKIRFPKGATRTFASGPYARYVTPPTVLSAATAPTLTPDYARILIVWKALELWSLRGGFRDPTPFEKRFQKAAWGDPATPGDIGVIGALKTANVFGGSAAYAGETVGDSFATLNTVDGYATL